ncbi:MAG: VTT domain-containing protein [Acidobacteriota bacterium]|nr:VTT domain-containing protein [Acidobacteriota bacterium]
MNNRMLLAVAAPTVAHNVRHWIYQLGGLGLIPLGLLDNSVVPLPGSMDVLTIVLAARDARLWFYYALMATIGSVLGAFVTFRLARKGGKETLQRRVSAARAEKIIKIFSTWGFWSIAIAALLPPPVPMVPFVIAAGATQYSSKKFLAALTLGRAVRYTALALLGVRYGRGIIGFVTHPGHPYIFAAVAAVVIAGVILFVVMSARKKKHATA